MPLKFGVGQGQLNRALDCGPEVQTKWPWDMVTASWKSVILGAGGRGGDKAGGASTGSASVRS